jgi:spermidine synthase
MAVVAVALCFALSGFAALLYQTAWTRQFSLVFGTSELAVATVLAAYMGGLALGARTVERFLDRIRRPVLAYGILEFGVGIAALAVPLLLLAAEKAMVAMLGGQAEPPGSDGWIQTAFYVLTAFAVLVVPTALMGATLPLLTRHVVHTPQQIGSRTGLLYAVNTFGAVGGALVSAYILLPTMGLTRTVAAGAGVNIVVFGLAALIARRSPQAQHSAHQPDAAVLEHQRYHTRRFRDWDASARWILPVMLASGLVSFVYEVLWTRMLGYILGGSIFAFATMVASFLLGIAGGSLIAAPLARNRNIALAGFVICQLAIALCSAGIYLGLSALLPDRAGLAGNASIAIGVLLPATLFIGATFPFAVRILANEPGAAAAATARIYAWNTVGAIAGALIAGFLLIPALRFEGSIYVAVLANLTLALVACLVVVRARHVWSAAVLVAGVGAALLFRPEIPEKLLRVSPLNVDRHGELRFYEVGRSASVVVLEQDGALMLRTNGLPEALIEMTGIAPKFSGEFWLSPLAVIARPRTESMLVVGYGGGVVLDAVPPSVRHVDVIELEPKVIDANRRLSALRKRDPLLDPRVRIVLNDARGALSLTSKRYDAIVSQPSHPWTAGASHLYTREFMQQARAHLSDGGVFLQWMNVSFLDEDLLRSLAATLLDVFANVRLYRPDPSTLVFLGSDQPLELEKTAAGANTPLALSPRHYSRFGIHVPEDIVAALAADQIGLEALARGAPLITDDMNRMATDNVYDRDLGLSAAKLSRILDAYDPLQRPKSFIYSELADQVSFGYIARRLALFTSIDATISRRIGRMAQLLDEPSLSAYVQAVAIGSGSDHRGAQRLLQESLALDPDNDAARYDWIRPWLAALAQARAPAEIAAEAARLEGAPAAVIQAGKHAVAGEWARLPALDSLLAAASYTDPWYVECVQMRADWRTRVTTPEHRARLGREALALIEEIIVSQPNAAMFALRARSAIAADRPDVLLESIYGYAQSTLESASRLNAEDVPALSNTLETLLKAIDEIGNDERVRQGRVQEVRTKIVLARDQIRSRTPASTAR